MTFTILEAGFDHLADVATLFDKYRVCYGCDTDLDAARAFISERMTRQDSIILVAVDQNGAAHGFAQLYPSFSSVAMRRMWILNDLFTDSVSRRQGIGKQLLKAAAQVAKASGAVRIDLATKKDNHSAKALYDRMGYNVDLVFDHYKLALD